MGAGDREEEEGKHRQRLNSTDICHGSSNEFDNDDGDNSQDNDDNSRSRNNYDNLEGETMRPPQRGGYSPGVSNITSQLYNSGAP